MRRFVTHADRSSLPGYSHVCAACPFCGRICDANHTETYCQHLVRWVGEAYHERAEFTDGVNEDEQGRS